MSNVISLRLSSRGHFILTLVDYSWNLTRNSDPSQYNHWLDLKNGWVINSSDWKKGIKGAVMYEIQKNELEGPFFLPIQFIKVKEGVVGPINERGEMDEDSKCDAQEEECFSHRHKIFFTLAEKPE